MGSDFVKNQKLWVPERSYGICIWVMPDGKPLSDGDGVLCAEGFVDDRNIEKQVTEAARYWTGSGEGRVAWVQGARKVSSSEREHQAERLANGEVADPYEDAIEYLIRRNR